MSKRNIIISVVLACLLVTGANLTASIRTLLGFEPGLLRKAGGLDNASVTILETNDFEHFTLKCWNDTSYMDEQNKIS